MLLQEDCSHFDIAVESFLHKYQPVEIEELCRLEFHHKKQDDGESVEQLGLVICLGRRAFPSMTGRQLDRQVLKCRFFQVLHVKWQRRLGILKPEETFMLYMTRQECLRLVYC